MKLIKKYRGLDFGDCRVDIVWSAVLPRDLGRLVTDEQTLVQNGIHSRRRAMREVGITDPEASSPGRHRTPGSSFTAPSWTSRMASAASI